MSKLKERQILVVIKEPGEPARVEPLFDNQLEAFQKAVGGYIEAVTFSKDLVVICNEEGRLLGLPFNTCVRGVYFVGPVVVCGYSDGGDFKSLKASSVMDIVRKLDMYKGGYC